jgi:protein-tyrosine phosphatase
VERAVIRNILFVCTGNICRSPLAEGLMRSLLRESGLDSLIQVDSAGIHARQGEPPDAVAVELAADDGIDIGDLRGRQFELSDFERFDLLLAMDREQLSHLKFICPRGSESRLAMLMSYSAEGVARDVVDPYRRHRRIFQQAWTDIGLACRGLLAQLQNQGQSSDDRRD